MENKFNISDETRVIANYYIYFFSKFNEFSKNILLPLLTIGVGYLIFKDGYKNTTVLHISYGLIAIFLVVISYILIFGFLSMIVVACDNLNKLTLSMTSIKNDEKFDLLNESLRFNNNQVESSGESTDVVNTQIKSIKNGVLNILLTAYSHKGSDVISITKCTESHYLKGYAFYFDEKIKKASFYEVTPRIELSDNFESNQEIGKLLIDEENYRLFPTISIPRKSSLAENLIVSFNQKEFKSVNARFGVFYDDKDEFSFEMKLLEGEFNDGALEFRAHYEILKERRISIDNIELGDEVIFKI